MFEVIQSALTLRKQQAGCGVTGFGLLTNVGVQPFSVAHIRRGVELKYALHPVFSICPIHGVLVVFPTCKHVAGHTNIS